MRTLLGILVVCLLSLAAIGWQTEGFTVVTTEAARRGDIARQPRRLPPATLLSSKATTSTLGEALASDGRVTIVNFIYTRCPSLCLTMGTEFQQLQDAIRRQDLEERVRMLSLSFDAADTPPYLARYAKWMKADEAVWEFAAIPDGAERKRLLEVFGIVVVEAPMGQFEHNAAYHVVAPDGRLSRILDVGDAAEALDYAKTLSKNRGVVLASRAGGAASPARGDKR